MKKLPVLIVEDNPVSLKSIVDILIKSLNVETELAENGLTAIEKLDQNQYSLVLLDIGLPDIDGLTVAETIRARHPDYSPLSF